MNVQTNELHRDEILQTRSSEQRKKANGTFIIVQIKYPRKYVLSILLIAAYLKKKKKHHKIRG